MNEEAILDNLHDMIVVVDNTFKTTYFNKSAKSVFAQLEKNKVINECFNTNYEEANRLLDSFKLITLNEKMDFIFNLEKEYFYFEIKLLENGSYLVEIVNLLESYLFNFLNSINNGWVICRPDNYEVIYANSTFFEITGYSKGEIMGKNLNILKADESDKKEREKIKIALKNLEPVKAVLKNKTKDERIIYNKVSISPIFNKFTGRIQFFLGVQSDITKEYTDRLHYKNILNTSKSIILTTSDKNLSSVNKRFFDLFPFSDFEDFKSKHNCICELFIQEMPHFIMPMMEGKTWLEYIKTCEPSVKSNILYMHKVCMIDKDGKKRIFQIDYAGKFSSTESEEEEVVLTEITDLINTQKALKEQTKMAAMGEMLSMIAHQWRQPLTTLSSIISKLKIFKDMNLLTDEKFNESNKKSLDIIQYMSTTINDFRNYFDKDDTKKNAVSLSNLINKSLIIFGSELKNKNIDLKINFIDGVENEIVSMNTSKIVQVLVNLIKNAHDALIEKDIKDKFIHIDVCYKHHFLKITVEDSAGGIPDDILDKVFEPYFSTKSKNGTGLGLYMSKMIIEEHYRGKLRVKNTNSGAKFTIILNLD